MKSIDEDWYPKVFNHYKDNLFRRSDYTIVSHIEGIDYNEKFYFSALVHPSQINLLTPDKIGNIPASSGPNPILPKTGDEYIPSFWIHTQDENLEIEPLIISYESNNKSIIWPDQGLLMTYGLIPRFQKNGTEIIWDEPALPEFEIIKCNPISEYNWGDYTSSEILVKNKYLEDYSTLRNRVIIQLFYEKIKIISDIEIENLLKDEKYLEIKNEDRYYRFQAGYNEYKYVVEISGFKILFEPGNTPVTSGRWKYEELIWPGIEEPVTKNFALCANIMTRIYVSDSVLETFQGKKEYDINPESGAVAYSNQWSVGFCHRVGRNVISIELKKMYEGVPPSIVKHWHSHSVDPPNKEYRNQKNISVYAKELLKAYLELGKTLANICSIILDKTVTKTDIIKLDERELTYSGWTSNGSIEVITRRIPEELNKEQFLQRCKYLNNLIVEGFSEQYLRRTLLKYGIDDEIIEEYGSLKLLELLVELKIISNNTGLDFIKSFSGIINRLDYININEYLKELFALYAFRKLDSHKIDLNNNDDFNMALETFSIDESNVESTYMFAIEIVYTKLKHTIIKINNIFK